VGMGSHKRQSFTEDPLRTGGIWTEKPSDSQLHVYGNPLPWQIAGPAAIVTMDSLRWGVTARTGGLLCRSDGMHGNFLRGSLNERDTNGGGNCQKLGNIHAAVFTSRPYPSSSLLRESRLLDALLYSFGLAWARKTGTPAIALLARRSEMVVLSLAGQRWLSVDRCGYRKEGVSAKSHGEMLFSC